MPSSWYISGWSFPFSSISRWGHNRHSGRGNSLRSRIILHLAKYSYLWTLPTKCQWLSPVTVATRMIPDVSKYPKYGSSAYSCFNPPFIAITRVNFLKWKSDHFTLGYSKFFSGSPLAASQNSSCISLRLKVPGDLSLPALSIISLISPTMFEWG